jgi:putative transcriptional regulator
MIKWKIKQVMVEQGLWSGQDLLERLEKKAGIIISHTAVMQLIKQTPKAIRFQTLEALCVALDCSPWDLIEYTPAISKEKGIRAVGDDAIHPYARRTSKTTPNKDDIYDEENF